MNYEGLSSLVKTITFITIAGFTLVVSSCANLSQLEKESFAEIEKLKNQFENNSENALYHIKLGSEYEKLGKARSSRNYYKMAISEYSKALDLEPSNTSLVFSLYQLTYLGVADWYADIQELSSLYQRIEENLRKNLNPPHLALFQRESARAAYGAVTEAQLEQILYKAFEESPLNARVSYLLSNFWIADKRYILSIDILRRALAAQPDNQFLNMQLGIAYEAYANQDYCPYEHPLELKKSIDLLQHAAKQIPNNPYLNYTLATLYERMNASILMVDSAKKLIAYDPSLESKLILAEALSNAGQFEKAKALYDELIAQGVTYAYLDRAMFYAENGDWQRSLASTKAYMERHNRMPIYAALGHLAMEKVLSQEATSLNEMSRYVDIAELSSWERALFDYWYGAISEQKLIELATNVCKATESKFLIGINKIGSHDSQQAKSYFEDIIDSKTYSFIEYRVARHLIRMLEK